MTAIIAQFGTSGSTVLSNALCILAYSHAYYLPDFLTVSRHTKPTVVKTITKTKVKPK